MIETIITVYFESNTINQKYNLNPSPPKKIGVIT